MLIPFVDAAATLFYYWVSFGPLSRGSAAVGYTVLAGLLVAARLTPPRAMPRGRQLDWEAILSPTPEAFLGDYAAWLRDAAIPATDDPLAGLPPPETAFPTLRARLAALTIDHAP